MAKVNSTTCTWNTRVKCQVVSSETPAASSQTLHHRRVALGLGNTHRLSRRGPPPLTVRCGCRHFSVAFVIRAKDATIGRHHVGSLLNANARYAPGAHVRDEERAVVGSLERRHKSLRLRGFDGQLSQEEMSQPIDNLPIGDVEKTHPSNHHTQPCQEPMSESSSRERERSESSCGARACTHVQTHSPGKTTRNTLAD